MLIRRPVPPRALTASPRKFGMTPTARHAMQLRPPLVTQRWSRTYIRPRAAVMREAFLHSPLRGFSSETTTPMALLASVNRDLRTFDRLESAENFNFAYDVVDRRAAEQRGVAAACGDVECAVDVAAAQNQLE